MYPLVPSIIHCSCSFGGSFIHALKCGLVGLHGLSGYVQNPVNCDDVIAGNIDVVMGGPPCQGVSGLNRHSARTEILKDGRYSSCTYTESKPRPSCANVQHSWELHSENVHLENVHLEHMKPVRVQIQQLQ